MRLQRENSGGIVDLSGSALAVGGEAKIYAVPQAPSLVAKVYHHPTDAHARKLAAMIANPPDDPMAAQGHILIAWPVERLHTLDGSRRCAGFLMPRVTAGRPIINFYNPKRRLQQCPLFDWGRLHITARNLAAAVEALHARGYVLGDVNESNILVTETALPTLVDTDSFQVRDPRSGQVFRCEVGTPVFTPPEFQGVRFADVDRTPAQDCFGLAVLLFQLLMEGTHPFAGAFQGRGEPPLLEERISSGHFPYATGRRVPVRPSTNAPPLEWLHPELQRLFRQCFEAGHTDPAARPAAHAWRIALEQAIEALLTCSANRQHRYANHLSACPWCERAVRLVGRDPFPSVGAVQTGQHLQPLPGAQRPQPSARPQPVPPPRPAPALVPPRPQPQPTPPRRTTTPARRPVSPAVAVAVIIAVVTIITVIFMFTAGRKSAPSASASLGNQPATSPVAKSPAPAPAASQPASQPVWPPNVPRTWKSPQDPTLELVLIPGGDFQMGSDQYEDEKPVHTVHVEPFFLGKYEVTNAQWKKFVDANSEWRKGGAKAKELANEGEGYLAHWAGNSPPVGKEQQPVICVSWYAAVAYCQWAGVRLPTEAEWEYAAQGGKSYEYGTSTGGIGPELANYDAAGNRSYGVAEALRYLKPVGSYDPNLFGIYDLCGNVWEWCSSEYKPYLYQANDGREKIPTNIDKNVNIRRVVRGGSWSSSGLNTRARYRDHNAPALTFTTYGLRCARAPRP